MAEKKKKKAYRRFEELTKQATAPMAAAAEQDRAEALPIRLSPEVRRALERQAAADNTTQSEIVEEALRRHLEV